MQTATQPETPSLLLSAESPANLANSANLASNKTQREPPPLLLSSQNTQNLPENLTQTTIPYTRIARVLLGLVIAPAPGWYNRPKNVKVSR